jgi:hypothetical protein
MNVDYEKIEKSWFIPKEKMAREMFEELEFEYKKSDFSITYYKEFRDYDDESYTLDIDFRLIEKKISSDFYIDMPLLKAINKQVEELGWK